MKVNKLESVCWFDPSVTAYQVPAGYSYRVYILHGKTLGFSGMTKTSVLKIKVKSED